MIKVEKCVDNAVWDEVVHDLGGHPLQLWGWGEVKALHNWSAVRLLCIDDEKVIGGAQILIRTLPKPFGVLLYAPRGPLYVTGREKEVLEAIQQYCKQKYRAVCLTFEPDSENIVPGAGWRQTANTILLPRTIVLDLEQNESMLLGAMSKKTRQYIRKSEKDGVTVRRITTKKGVDACLGIYKETAERAGFALHDDKYYYDIHEQLGESSVIFGAFVDDILVSFVWLAVSADVAFELYGGVNDAGQAVRANYVLKWHAILKCKEWNVRRYDMNGLLNDGVSTFKQGFAGHENRLVGTYDYPLSPLYSAWTSGLPLAKRVVRAAKRIVRR